MVWVSGDIGTWATLLTQIKRLYFNNQITHITFFAVSPAALVPQRRFSPCRRCAASATPWINFFVCERYDFSVKTVHNELFVVYLLAKCRSFSFHLYKKQHRKLDKNHKVWGSWWYELLLAALVREYWFDRKEKIQVVVISNFVRVPCVLCLWNVNYGFEATLSPQSLWKMLAIRKIFERSIRQAGSPQSAKTRLCLGPQIWKVTSAANI